MLFKDRNEKRHQDRLSQMMFGTRRQMKKESDIQSLIANVDYMELMEHVDTIMKSYSEFKPFINKINPMIGRFLKK
ncbi:hypothetical protein D0469_13145 [Peribacillus saganii]|uniref:Uncharacterized protein n=1 Tax=Peribacillus saganii TaxID=2303992 RepID=A0A372LLV0_9BACI|nr:hypothetical protein [Peribacillus saganii]RFU68033.1 hypothetical protein D0469_13145 [Peribacillus saganii]